MFFITEEAKETVFHFSQGTVEVFFFFFFFAFNINVKLSNSQLNKLKSEIKNGTKVALKISSNFVGDSNDGNRFSHKLLLTNTQVSRLLKTFANNFSPNIKFSKIQLHKIGQSGGILDRLFKPLLKSFGSGRSLDLASRKTKVIISNEEMNYIMKIIKSLEESLVYQ